MHNKIKVQKHRTVLRNSGGAGSSVSCPWIAFRQNPNAASVALGARAGSLAKQAISLAGEGFGEVSSKAVALGFCTEAEGCCYRPSRVEETYLPAIFAPSS